MAIAVFKAFYPTPIYWAGPAPTFVEGVGWDKALGDVVFKDSTSAYQLKVCRDGMIQLHVPALTVSRDAENGLHVKHWSDYLEYINTFYFLLDKATRDVMNFAIFDLAQVVRSDACLVTWDDDAWLGCSAAGYNVAMIRTSERYLNRPLPFHAASPFEVPLEVLNAANSSFQQVLSVPGLHKVLAAFSKCVSEYKVGNYEIAIVQAWFISEKILRQMWIDFLKKIKTDPTVSGTRISADRLKSLIKGEDYTIAVISNLLELVGSLELEMLNRIDRTRRNRNKIAHANQQYVATVEDANDMLLTASALASKLYKYDIDLNLGYTLGI